MMNKDDFMGLQEDLFIRECRRKTAFYLAEAEEARVNTEAYKKMHISLKDLSAKLAAANLRNQNLIVQATETINICNSKIDFASSEFARANKMFEQYDADVDVAKEQLRLMTERAQKAEKALADLRQQNNETLASNNSAVLALNDATTELKKLASVVPDRQIPAPEYFTRTIRSKHFNNQINDLISKGDLRTDPRKSSNILQRPWYEATPESDTSLDT